VTVSAGARPLSAPESEYIFAAHRNSVRYPQLQSSSRHGKLTNNCCHRGYFISNQPSLASLQKRSIDPDSLGAKYPR